MLKNLKAKMKELIGKIHEEVIRRDDEKLKKRLKKEFKEMRLKKRAEHKVIINNHVD